jgi:hypothetical protein
MATLSAHVPRPYESLTRYLGRYSCRRRGERAKQAALANTENQNQEAEPLPDRPKSSWAACIKRIYEINPLECPICKGQMRIIAFIQDPDAISAIMKAMGIPNFRAPPAIPKYIDTQEAIDELPDYDSFH